MTSTTVEIPRPRLAIRAVLSRVVAVVTGKGGIMKTSTIAAMAAEAARRGMKVLIVEVDSSGACSRYEMGLADTEHDDRGRSLANALMMTMMGTPTAPAVVQAVRTYPPLTEGRPAGRIDIVVGGPELDSAIEVMASIAHVKKIEYVHVLAEVVAMVAPGYGLVLIDNDPKNKPVRLMVLNAAAASYAPVDCDPAAYEDGLAILRDEIAEARTYNPEHFFIGAVPVRIPETTIRAWRNKQDGGTNKGGELVVIMEEIHAILADPVFDVERALVPGYPRPFKAIIRDAKLPTARARKAKVTIVDYLTGLSSAADEDGLLTEFPILGDYRTMVEEVVGAIGAIESARASA